MEKIELKHLAPYLPYKLMVKLLDEKPRVMIASGSSSVNWIGIGACIKWNKFCEPILRPLSDLTRLGTPIIQPYTDCLIIINQLHILNNDVSILPYQLFEILLEHHFDVFGLIDKGLAISIHDIEK